MIEIIIYFAIINLITFVSFWHDKRISMCGGRRIPEKTLLLFSLVGGSFAAIIASKIFRHKTKKQPFKALLYLIIFMQILGVILLLNNSEAIAQLEAFIS
jgi:uncharacterized membrane protein YsdA (DUF1294 family)